MNLAATIDFLTILIFFFSDRVTFFIPSPSAFSTILILSTINLNSSGSRLAL